jgi:hypothetical protein
MAVYEHGIRRMRRWIPQIAAAGSVNGDPIAAAINADGKSIAITFKGMATGGTYLYDTAGAGETLGLTDTSTAKGVLTVVSKGFDSTGAATTTSRTVYVTRRLRVAGTSGADETTSGSDVVINFALSEPVYAKDTTGGGNSGTAPVLVTLSGLYTKSAVPSNAKTVTCVNNSALAYYTPRGQWGTIDRQKVLTDFDLEFDPQHLHGVAGIACVVFTCTGQTSSHVESATVTSRTARQRAGTSLYSDAYKTTITLSGFTQGEDIACRVRVYPSIGDTAFDSDNQSSDYLVQHDNTLTFKCDKTAALEVFGIVDTGGSDVTGTASATIATARALPFATIQKAERAGASKIYIKNQTHLYTTPGSTPTALGYWCVVQLDPTDLGGIVTIDTGFVTVKSTYLKFKGCTMKLTGNLSIFTGTTRNLWFDGITFDANGQTLAGPICDDIAGAVFTDCAIDPLKFKLNRSGTDIVRHSFDGCDFGSPSSDKAVESFWRAVACKSTANVSFNGAVNVTASPLRANVLVKNNRLLSVTTPIDFDVGLTAATTDYFFIGNEFEGLTAGLAGSPAFSFGQAGTEYDKDHVVIAHNTILGERENHLYNDGAGDNTAVKYRRYASVVGVGVAGKVTFVIH